MPVADPPAASLSSPRLTGPAALRPGLGSIVLLAALAAVGQFASNIYTPSLPFVASDLGVDAGLVQSTFGIFLLTFAAMQLVYGPLADRFGRRPVLFAALALFLAGTIACAVADITASPALMTSLP